MPGFSYTLPVEPKIGSEDFDRDGNLTKEAYKRALHYAHRLRDISCDSGLEDVAFIDNKAAVTLNAFMNKLSSSDARYFREQFQITDFVRGGEFHTGRF